MIKDFLIINFTGKNNSIGLRIDSNFFVKKYQTNISNNETIIKNILEFLEENKVTYYVPQKNVNYVKQLFSTSFFVAQIRLNTQFHA